MHECVPVNICDCLRHIQSHTDHQQQTEPQIYNRQSCSPPTNQEVCHVTKNPLNLSLLVFSEDDYCLCLWRWIEQATHECTSSLPPLSLSTAKWWQWWETPSGGEMYHCSSKPSCHIHRTESVLTHTSQNNEYDRYTCAVFQFKGEGETLLWIWIIKI